MERSIDAVADIYARTWNPMYQSFFTIALGLAVVLRIDGAVVMLIPAGLILHYGVVLARSAISPANWRELSAIYFGRTALRLGVPVVRQNPFEAVEPLRIVHQDAPAHRFVRHPHRDLIDQIAVVRHRRLQ